MFPSWLGSIAASCASESHRVVSSRWSALASPFTYLSNQAVVYQATSSAPRSVAPKARLGIQLNSQHDVARLRERLGGEPVEPFGSLERAVGYDDAGSLRGPC